MRFKIVYFIELLLLAPLLYAFTVEGARFLASVFSFESTMWFLLGAFLALVAYLVLLKQNIGFWQVLLHELEHAVVLFLFTLQWPKLMTIEPPNGVTIGSSGCFIVRWTPLVYLAPYYLALLTIPVLLLKAGVDLAASLLDIAFPPVLGIVLDFLIGATLVIHLATTAKEFRFSQPDIKNSGLIVSLVTVFFISFMFLVLSIAVVTESYAEYWNYVKTAFAAGLDIYRASFEWIKTAVPQAIGSISQRIKDL
jgi:hypothetical protein